MYRSCDKLLLTWYCIFVIINAARVAPFKFIHFGETTIKCLQISNPLTTMSAIKVALTRECGSNNKLKNLLLQDQNLDITCVELPCIEFILEPGFEKLEQLTTSHDAVLLTSPQAAEVFLKYWRRSRSLKTKVVSVGKGTSEPLKREGLVPIFEPTSASGACLANELPIHIGNSILYPCSSIASANLNEVLSARGFQVTRIDTYSTVPKEWSDDDYMKATKVDIVSFASPSTVEVWNRRIGNNKVAVVIGPTTEKAAVECGFANVFTPSDGSHSIFSWAGKIKEVCRSIVNG